MPDANMPATFRRGDAARIAAAVRRVEGGNGGQGVGGNAGGGALCNWMAKVTGATRHGDEYQWLYDTVEIKKKDKRYGEWDTVSGGRTTSSSDADDNDRPGLNMLENMNGTSGLMGCGVTVPLPDGFDLGPVPVGAIVRVWEVLNPDASRECWFSAPNAVTGECQDSGGDA